MAFRAFHGCLESEKTLGNDFRVDFSASFGSCAACSDSLEDTLDYGKIYSCIASVMNGESCNLLETLATRISCAVRASFPELLDMQLTVAKKNPPVAGPCEWSEIELSWSKDE